MQRHAWRMDIKETLRDGLRLMRSDLLAKLDGLSEYDMRRPMTDTGTNLLGLVKHVASVELGYFTDVFGRPGRQLAWYADDAEEEADMWATPEESSESIIELHHFSAEKTDETIDALELDSPAYVPWWTPERRDTNLGKLLVHMTRETARHAGHADIIRELIDGQAGLRAGDPNIRDRDWAEHRARLEAAAATFQR